MPVLSKEPLSPVPNNLSLFKGSRYVIISRKLAHDVLTDAVYLEFKIGSEVEVLQDLIMQGSLQHLDTVMIEYHTWMAKDSERKRASTILEDIMTKIGELNDIMKNQGDSVQSIKVLPLDDETYYLSNKPLPEC